MSIVKVYVAGPYNGRNVIEVIENIHHGLQLNSLLKRMGYRTYCPWSDFLEALFLPDRSGEQWKADALDELMNCDALVLADLNPRWQDSQGTIDELATCARHNIPVFAESNIWTLPCWIERMEKYSPSDQENNGGID